MLRMHHADLDGIGCTHASLGIPSLEGRRSPCVRGACTRIPGCQSLLDYTGSGVLRGY